MGFAYDFSRSTCNICGRAGKFRVTDLNPAADEVAAFRENIFCAGCGSISRDRMMIYGLQRYMDTSVPVSRLKRDKNLRILETSGTRGHPPYLEKLYDYYNIWYEPEALKKDGYDIRKHGNLECLEFKDDFFNLVISSDVLEHVRMYRKALEEVYRTLKKGGHFILQVPFAGMENKNIELVKVEDNKDIFLAPPQYHATNTLVYRIYGGRDLLDSLWETGFHVRYMESAISEHAISRQNIFICTK